ncbi:MAG: c-type cytochrome [Verrucomicrobia bacterium]|nr:c-type cytochrome [Verrucomicrobiota bacterium]
MRDFMKDQESKISSALRAAGILVLFLVLAASRARAADTHDPNVELASFQIADGFEANLFASEKDGVVKPIQMRFDARGRLWVIGSTVYPQIEPGEIPNDKVLMLEDTDRDGRCDKTTVFADGLMIPTGIELGDGGVYLGHGTDLLFLKDTDGDGKADESRVVLRGFGTGDNHQNINSFLWGPGGELWMCQGLHTRSHVETPWGIQHLEQAGIWRLRTRRLKLEGFYGSAHEPQNPWGFAFTDWGEPIVLAGNNSSPIYPVPGMTAKRREAPPAIIWKNGQGRKAGGGDIVGAAHFPEAWQGALILAGYINNAVWTLKISDDGAGFVLEDLPPLIKSTSRYFRPVDAKFGPDGALYLCDWYNPIIGHYQASFRHPDRDKTHGRIWRITAKGRSLTKPPLLADASLPDLLEHLKSPDRWTRHFAKRVLADRPAGEVKDALKVFVARPGLSEHALKEALGVYQSHEIVAPNLLERLCRAADPNARAYAAGVVGAWADRLSNPLTLLRALAKDENARVRLQAVVACTYIPKAEAMEVAALAADFPTDKFLTYALNQVVFALKPCWLAPFQAGKLNLENKQSRLSMLVSADGTADTLQAVRDILRATPMEASAKEVYLRILAEHGDGNDFSELAKLSDTSLQARLLPIWAAPNRVRSFRLNRDPSYLIRPLVESPDTRVQAEALRLAGAWKCEGVRDKAESTALDTRSNEHLRRAAIEALALFGGDSARKVLSQLATVGAPSIQAAAIAGLTQLDLAVATPLAVQGLARLQDDAPLSEIFSAFLQRQGGAAALASALSTARPPKRAAEAGLRVMSASGRRDETLARLLNDAAGFNQEGRNLATADIRRLTDEVHAQGDAQRGAEIFRRAELGCVACHAVHGQGGNIGPELSNLGTAQPIDFIIGAILDPQKEIKEGYTSISVTTKTGEEYQGYQLRETGDEIVVRDVLQSKEIRVRRDAIKEKKLNGSVMPAGLADTLTRAEFRDLVRFLSELGKPK